MTTLHFVVPGTPRPKGRHRNRIVKRKGAGDDLPKINPSMLAGATREEAWQLGVEAGRASAPSKNDYFSLEYADPETEREESRVAAYCQRAMVEQDFCRVDAGAVALFVLAVFQIPKSCSKAEVARRIWHTQTPDDDNLRKIVADALNGLAWKDDCQIVSGPPYKAWSTSEEFVEVWVLPIDTAPEKFYEQMAAYKALNEVVVERWGKVMMAGREQQLGLAVGG